ncbi:MAG TPA: hypothetical protein P5555_15065 [Candidatus Paceibacterota bacterium]|nr:hypothetical protein [Verrucomicrobiota bacterium]HOX01338.1 hypothetical protein [Verrucomicrobiota bacterium]HRZ46502.1 hypothetical protein [Candidatus Paceibacterota bacterium]HRZ91734.1 hypothetical protein [Candidatus Paceibacterota bacterium]
MNMPQRPPLLPELLRKQTDPLRLNTILELSRTPSVDYPHWDKLRHLAPPGGFISENGFTTATPALAKSRSLPVATVRPWVNALAATSDSMGTNQPCSRAMSETACVEPPALAWMHKPCRPQAVHCG